MGSCQVLKINSGQEFKGQTLHELTEEAEPSGVLTAKESEPPGL